MTEHDLNDGEIFLWTVSPLSAKAPNLKGWLRQGPLVIHLIGWNNSNNLVLQKQGWTNVETTTKSPSGTS